MFWLQPPAAMHQVRLTAHLSSVGRRGSDGDVEPASTCIQFRQLRLSREIWTSLCKCYSGDTIMNFSRSSKTFRAVSVISGTIFLGALGSGLWEKIFRPVSESFTNAILSLFAVLFHGYVDMLHRDIGKAYHDTMSLVPYNVLLTFALLFPVATATYGYLLTRRIQHEIAEGEEDEQEDDEDLRARLAQRVRRMRQIVLLGAVPLAIVNLVFYSATALQDLYTRKACNYVERSIDILAPELSPAEVLKLRAQYRSVGSAAAFYELDTHMRALARAKNITLPEFQPIR